MKQTSAHRVGPPKKVDQFQPLVDERLGVKGSVGKQHQFPNEW